MKSYLEILTEVCKCREGEILESDDEISVSEAQEAAKLYAAQFVGKISCNLCKFEEKNKSLLKRCSECIWFSGMVVDINKLP